MHRHRTPRVVSRKDPPWPCARRASSRRAAPTPVPVQLAESAVSASVLVPRSVFLPGQVHRQAPAFPELSVQTLKVQGLLPLVGLSNLPGRWPSDRRLQLFLSQALRQGPRRPVLCSSLLTVPGAIPHEPAASRCDRPCSWSSRETSPAGGVETPAWAIGTPFFPNGGTHFVGHRSLFATQESPVQHPVWALAEAVPWNSIGGAAGMACRSLRGSDTAHVGL